MDVVSQQRLVLVMPELASKITALITGLEAEGHEVRVVQGLRTWQQQDALYAQGRTAPGEIVTNARGGESYHNFGLAVDLVPSINGIEAVYQPDWNSAHPLWKEMESKGEALGLVSGSLWRTLPDAPHFQLTGEFSEDKPTAQLFDFLKNGGLTAVWAAVRASFTGTPA